MCDMTEAARKGGFSLSKSLSLRASQQTGVAIRFQNA